MNICIFEDEGVKNLSPLADFRPAFDLRAGALLIRDKIRNAFPDDDISYLVREEIAPIIKAKYPDAHVNQDIEDKDVLFINGRLLMDDTTAEAVKKLESGQALVNESGIVAVRNSAESFDPNDIGNLGSVSCSAVLVNYIWELISANAGQIESDFLILTGGNPTQSGNVSDAAHLINSENIHISDGADLQAGVVLDASRGSIYIGKDAVIMANSFIEGPSFIGNGSVIKARSKIYGGTSIGEVCKVGGEVENSIMHSYSNKQHDGFLGHSYLGSWVNLGANTNTSDLKNDYGNVKVHCEGELIDAGSKHIGLMMGDHSKSGINTMFNTGTVVGSSCNLFGGGFHPKYVPSFSWGGQDSGYSDYRLEKAVDVAENVMSRRDVRMSAAEKALFQSVFDASAEDRKSRS